MVAAEERKHFAEPYEIRIGEMSHGVFLALAAILTALTICRILLAATADLAEDEAYYWLWSTHLALSYYDHPPMIAYWIRAGTSIFGDAAFGVRVVGLLSVLGGSYLLFETVIALFKNRTAAALSAIWLNATLLCNAAAIIATPDTPLAFFATLTLFGLTKLIDTGDGRYWLLIGAGLGCAFLSKYTAALLLPGIGLWLLLTKEGRSWLPRPQPYLGAVLALILISPVVYWNYLHDWASFAKQAHHGVKDKPANALQSVGELIGGQAGLLTPLVFAFCMFGIGFATWRGMTRRDPRWLSIGLFPAPALLFFSIHSASQKIQPNWPGFLYSAAIVAGVCAFLELNSRRALPSWLRWSFHLAPVLALIFTAGAFLQLGFSVLPVPAKKDPTSRLKGWSALVTDIAAIRAQTGAGVILTDRYAITGEISYYLGDPAGVLEVKERIRYANLPPPQDYLLAEKPSMLVVRHGEDVAYLSQYFGDRRLVTTLVRRGGFQPQDAYDVYIFSHYRGGLFS